MRLLRVLTTLVVALLAATPALAAKRAILIYGSGEEVRAADALRPILLGRGFTVVNASAVPSDLDRYCCAYDLRPFEDLSPTDRARYQSFLQLGHGLMVFGENIGCCASRNATITGFIRDTLGGGDVLVSPTDELLGVVTESANAGHTVNNTPNRVRDVTYNGRGAGVFERLGRGTDLTHLASYPDKVAAVWDETRLLGATQGRLIAVLDINWLIDTYGSTDNAGFAENISHFLCPDTDFDLEVTITNPGSFTRECPDTVTVQGVVEGVDEDCAQPTRLAPSEPLPPRDVDPVLDWVQRGGTFGDATATEVALGPVASYGLSEPESADLAALLITAIDVSLNGGPYFAVTSTSPALPAMPPVNFTAANLPLVLGGNSVSIRARAAGREAFDSVNGVLRDTLPPVISPPSCADEIVDLGAGCRLDYTNLPTAADVCDPTVTITSVPPLPIVFTGPGATTVTYTASDDSGNRDTCARNVTAIDIGPPLIVCPAPLTLECTTPGGLPDTDADVRAWIDSATVSDNCTANPPLSHDAPTTFPAGCSPGLGTRVTWESEDESRNRSTCSSTLAVEDTTPPEITSTPTALTLECNQAGGVARGDADVLAWIAMFQASDLCLTNATLDDDAPPLIPSGCSPGNATLVTFGAEDSCGNRDTFTETLTIVDTTPPTLTAPPPLTLECDAAGGVPKSDAAIQAWLSSVTSGDICGSVTVTDDAPALLPSGCGLGLTTVVTFTASDNCGNAITATSTITVMDTSAPDLTVPAPLVLECNGPGGVARTDAQIQAWLALATASDVCGGFTLTHDAPALLPSGCGAGTSTTVKFTAIDDCGNAIERSSTITVRDTTSPSLIVPMPLTLECNGPGGIAVTDAAVQAFLAAASASDVCDGATITHDAPVLLPSGCGAGTTTTITFIAEDNCGNAFTATSTITVKDTTRPSLTPPAPITLECNSPAGVPLSDAQIQSWLAATSASDVCDGATITHDAPTLFPSACGPGQVTTVTFTAVDNCGNTGTATATVTVRDTTAPTLTTPAPLALECNGAGGVRGDDPQILSWLSLASATDVCDGATLTNDSPPFYGSACTPGAATTVTFRAVDNCANLATGSSTVTVVDTTPPTLAVPAPLALECTAPGGVPAADPRVVAWLASATGSDICDGTTITHDAPALIPSGCGGLTTTVTFVAIDDCGNRTVKTSTITVSDTTPPDLTVPAPLELECDATSGVPASDPRIVAWRAAASASDICDGATISDDAPAFFASGCLPGAVTTVTFTASDDCGNATTKTSTVTVVDTTPPDASALLRPFPIVSPKPPRRPAPAKSVCSPPTTRDFTVECAASDICDAMPTVSAALRVTNHDVTDAGSCALRVDLVDVACGEVVTLRLLAPPCPARGPSSPAPPLTVDSRGIKVISGEAIVLEVTATDNCGNAAVDDYDPSKEPSPLCDEVLEDGTCCPAIAHPPDEKCKVPPCGRLKAALLPESFPPSRLNSRLRPRSNPSSADSGRIT